MQYGISSIVSMAIELCFLAGLALNSVAKWAKVVFRLNVKIQNDYDDNGIYCGQLPSTQEWNTTSYSP